MSVWGSGRTHPRRPHARSAARPRTEVGTHLQPALCTIGGAVARGSECPPFPSASSAIGGAVTLPVGLKRNRRHVGIGKWAHAPPVGPMRDGGAAARGSECPPFPSASSAIGGAVTLPVGLKRNRRHVGMGKRAHAPPSALCAIGGAAASGSGYADPAGLKRNRRHAGMGKRAHAPRRPHARLAARLRAEVNVRPSSQPHGRSAARLPFQSATCTICGAAACGSGRGKRSSARCASKSADEFRPRWAGPERAFNGRGCRRRLQYAKSRGSVRGSAYKRTRGRIPRRSFRAWRARRAGAVRCRR